ncbi:MAG TPA: tRNA lysidine(34) synthetase TilS [Burkholderiales bacterium]
MSGGVDSVVLLDVLVQITRLQPLRLTALHVNHHISPNAARWAQFCAACCTRYGVPCAVADVQVEVAGGASLEAAAREARYAVFQRQDVDALLLAHHLDDQAETLLLQLLRGAGPRGLSGMPEVREAGVRILRPLLEVPRAQIVEYARRRRLDWVEDESNALLDFDRNYLRHEVLPRIAARFPGYRETWLRASRNFADVSELAEALARIDAEGALDGTGLRIGSLRELGQARARNLLRWFLMQHGLRPPGRERLDEALRQLLGQQPDAQPLVELGPASLRRHRGVARLVQHTEPAAASWQIAWQGEEALPLPNGMGTLCFDSALGEGLSAVRLRAAGASVRGRTGGERLKLAADRPSRTLKNLLREAGVPAWQRERLPLLFCGEAAVWAPGVGCDCRFAAAPGEKGVLPRWVP